MPSFVSERINHPYDTLYSKLQAANSLSIFADVNNCLPGMFFSKSTKIRRLKEKASQNNYSTLPKTASIRTFCIIIKKRKEKIPPQFIAVLILYSCSKVIGYVLWICTSASALKFLPLIKVALLSINKGWFCASFISCNVPVWLSTSDMYEAGSWWGCRECCISTLLPFKGAEARFVLIRIW